ncbi:MULTISPECIES: DUF6705 family protein [Chryseobacterium]|uniref:DUF6705 domain-containing protein n=1 Tax=Chryseobacterium geocarposphaerae TaxID=1416776 RepID=A0ABU1LGT4_9FLAO|nr:MULTISPECIES: DUF6705 family protein [Chryseobacterium]MDR6405937.1 hypothetical protein [Chryseobacterium geocarposphaerae]MDR6699618.1 hypothetical protein [Chryseobacterium ginsenosidimutans]
MKNLKNILLLSFFISAFSCKAQQYPLDTDFRNIPNNSYLKDLNNELDPYIGTYQTIFNGKQITLFVTKEPHKLIDYVTRKFYRDVLSIKFVVKNSNGVILQDTQNLNSQNNTIYSMRINPYHNFVTFNYSGTNCNVGNGRITLKKLNITQVSWEYLPDDIILDNNRCPPGTDINIYLPETKDLIFTKQ